MTEEEKQIRRLIKMASDDGVVVEMEISHDGVIVETYIEKSKKGLKK